MPFESIALEPSPATSAPEPAAPAPAPEPASAPAPAASAPVDGIDFNTVPEPFRPQAEALYKQVSEKHKQELAKFQEESRPLHEKAQALEKLLAEPWFQKAWVDRQSPTPAAPQAAARQAFTPEEWQGAYDKALAGDMTAMNELTERQLESLVQKKYEPVMQQMAHKQREMELGMEMSEMFKSHPEAADFDKAGLLEQALHLHTDKRGKPMEYAFQQAKKTYDYIYNKAKQDLTTQAQGKKAATTETPSMSTADSSVVYVDSPQQAFRQQLMATAKGLKVRYVVKPRGK